MSTKRRTAVVAIVLLAFAGSREPRAVDGSIPIFKATTIAQPGHYVLTRDFSVASGDALSITANNVTLDLNGRTVTNASSVPGDYVIQIDTSTATRGLVIRNGRLAGGAAGIGDIGTGHLSVRIEEIEVSNSGAGIAIDNTDSIEVVGCHIHDTTGIGIFAQVSSSPLVHFAARIVENRIERVVTYGIWLQGVGGGEISRNVVEDCGSGSANLAGIKTVGSFDPERGTIIEGNTVSCLPGGVDDDGMQISPGNSVIRDNIVQRNGRYGIWSQSDETRIEGNIANQNGSHGINIGTALAVARNLLEGNQTQGNSGCGINFANTSSHIYRNNVVRTNSGGGICGGGAPNTDAGGNIL